MYLPLVLRVCVCLTSVCCGGMNLPTCSSGARVGGEWEDALIECHTRCLQLFLCLAHGGELRVSVNHPGDRIVVHVPRETCKAMW